MARKSSVNLNTASQQWLTRADEERFLSLDDIYTAASARQAISREHTFARTDAVLTVDSINDQRQITIHGPGYEPTILSNLAFQQICRHVGAPANYLEKLPDQMVSDILQHGIDTGMGDCLDSFKLLTQGAPGDPGSVVRCITSPTYGRIWDSDVIKAVQDNMSPETWQVPAASYAANDPKRASTLYLGDRSVFLFMVAPDQKIDGGGGELVYPGFMKWNSEVQSTTFPRTYGLTTFYCVRVCDNRIIWGAEQVKSLVIKHTSGAPERFLNEAVPTLESFRDAAEGIIGKVLAKARTQVILKKADTNKEGDDLIGAVEKFLRANSFTKTEAAAGSRIAADKYNDPTILWNVIQGVTDYAHNIQHQGERVDLETRAGNLLNLVKV